MSQPANVIVTEKADQAVVIRVKAKLLDENGMQQLIQALDAIPAEATGTVVVIDLAQVEFLPSLCLGGMVHIANKCRERSQKLKLAAIRSIVRKVFVITRLDRSFELCESVEAALRVQA